MDAIALNSPMRLDQRAGQLQGVSGTRNLRRI